MLCVSLHIDDLLFIAHAQKRHPGSLYRPEKCKRDSNLASSKSTSEEDMTAYLYCCELCSCNKSGSQVVKEMNQMCGMQSAGT